MDSEELRTLSDFIGEETDYYIDLNKLDLGDDRTLALVHTARALKSMPPTSEDQVTIRVTNSLENALDELVDSYAVEE